MELSIRRYFEHFMEKVLPRAIAAAIEAHDESEKAHGGIVSQIARMRWTTSGALIGVGAGSGVGITKLLQVMGVV